MLNRGRRATDQLPSEALLILALTVGVVVVVVLAVTAIAIARPGQDNAAIYVVLTGLVGAVVPALLALVRTEINSGRIDQVGQMVSRHTNGQDQDPPASC